MFSFVESVNCAHLVVKSGTLATKIPVLFLDTDDETGETRVLTFGKVPTCDAMEMFEQNIRTGVACNETLFPPNTHLTFTPRTVYIKNPLSYVEVNITHEDQQSFADAIADYARFVAKSKKIVRGYM
jgi:hypothetical protein